MGFLAGIVKTVFSNIQNSDKMISCHAEKFGKQQERSLEIMFILAQMTIISFNTKIYEQLYQESVSRVSTKSIFPATHCPLSHKITQSLYIARVSLAAYYLVLLSGDVNPNPGPISDSHNIGLPRAQGLKLAHLNA